MTREQLERLLSEHLAGVRAALNDHLDGIEKVLATHLEASDSSAEERLAEIERRLGTIEND